MRTLKFIVDEHNVLNKDPNCNFENLVPGTVGCLQAEFSFPPEWNDFVKVAAFKSPMGTEYPPQALADGKTCMIPSEALKKRLFRIQIMGKNGDRKLLTDTVAVCQNGGKK